MISLEYVPSEDCEKTITSFSLVHELVIKLKTNTQIYFIKFVTKFYDRQGQKCQWFASPFPSPFSKYSIIPITELV